MELEVGSDDVLVGKNGTKSAVWNYFGFRPDENGRAKEEDRPICRVCRIPVRAKNGNTSNLFSHIKNKHCSIYKDLMSLMDTEDKRRSMSMSSVAVTSQPTLNEVVHKSQQYEKNGKQWTRLTAAVTHCIAKDALPIYIVEKAGFRHDFDGRYTLPSRSYFSRTAIPALYESTRQVVLKEVEAVEYYSATTDLWSSVGLKPYISFTIHFIDKDWKLRSRCLQTEFLPDDHTADNIAEALEDIVHAWKLSANNLVCLTTDNGANIVCAARKLGWLRLSCFGHNLHLAIGKSMEDHRCSRALALCKKVVSTFSMSWKKRKHLLQAQLDLKLPQKCLVAVS